MDYIDTYVSCAGKAELEAFASQFSNSTPAFRGQAATEATQDTPEKPAVGDPSLWYVCIRTLSDIYPIVVPPISIVDYEIGKNIVIFA